MFQINNRHRGSRQAHGSMVRGGCTWSSVLSLVFSLVVGVVREDFYGVTIKIHLNHLFCLELMRMARTI